MKALRLTPKRLVQFACISGASLLYYIPYMIPSYYNVFVEVFNSTNTQLNALTSAYTTTTVLTYFLGGLLADKISSRKLLAFTFVSTGVLCFLFGLFPPYPIAMAIMIALGVTTTLTFWAAMQKATRIFIGEGNEGVGTGSVEGVRSILSSIVCTIAVACFAKFADPIIGVRFVIWFFAVILTAIGIIAWFVLEKDVPTNENLAKNLITCLKDKNVWLMSMIVFFFFVPSVFMAYIATYSTQVFGLSVALGAALGLFKEYFRPFGAIFAAATSGKRGTSKMLVVFGVIVALINFGYALVPQDPALVMILVVGSAIGYIALGAVRGLYFATVGEANVSMGVTGTVIGIMSTIGFAPDSFGPLILGKMLDTMPAERVYPLIFIGCGVCCLIGVVLTIVFRKVNKDNIDRIESVRKESKAK